jgi:hypothetical protein
MLLDFAPTRLQGHGRSGLLAPVALTGAWQGPGATCVPIALMKGLFHAQGGVITDDSNSKLVAQGKALHLAHSDSLGAAMEPEAAAKLVPGVKHLKTFMAVRPLAAPACRPALRSTLPLSRRLRRQTPQQQ